MCGLRTTTKSTDMTELFEHQKEGIAFLKKHPRAILADEMGLGKTRQAIIAAGQVGDGPILVICPASLKINWQREIRMVYPEDEIAILGDEGNRWVATWVVVNYDQLEKWENEIVELLKPKTLILDEAHYIKNTRSKRTKATLRIARTVKRVYALTGTLILNRPLEAFPVLQAIGHELGKNWMTYIRRYCRAFPRKNPYTGGTFWDATGASNIPELRRKLDTVMLRREKKDVLDLPEKIVTHIPVELDEEWQKRYERAWDDYVAFLEANPPENMDSILQARHLVELQKLKQVVSQSKVERIVEHAEEILQSEPVVIFTQYAETLKMVATALKKHKVVILDGSTPQKARQEAVDAFQAGTARVFIGNMKAAGVGITLTAATKVIFADLDWTPATHAQAEDRLHRIGQKGLVNAYYFIGTETIDEDIIDLLGYKEEVIAKIIAGEEMRRAPQNMVEEVAKRLAAKWKLSTR